MCLQMMLKTYSAKRVMNLYQLLVIFVSATSFIISNLMFERTFIWIVILRGCEIWTFHKNVKNRLEADEIWRRVTKTI